MARHPEWFSRLDMIEETLQQQVAAEWFGRQEVAAAFGVSNRDSIRLLHQFGGGWRATHWPSNATHCFSGSKLYGRAVRTVPSCGSAGGWPSTSGPRGPKRRHGAFASAPPFPNPSECVLRPFPHPDLAPHDGGRAGPVRNPVR